MSSETVTSPQLACSMELAHVWLLWDAVGEREKKTMQETHTLAPEIPLNPPSRAGEASPASGFKMGTSLIELYQAIVVLSCIDLLCAKQEKPGNIDESHLSISPNKPLDWGDPIDHLVNAISPFLTELSVQPSFLNFYLQFRSLWHLLPSKKAWSNSPKFLTFWGGVGAAGCAIGLPAGRISGRCTLAAT